MTVFDSSGDERGFIDRVSVEGDNLIVAGWVQAKEVKLVLCGDCVAMAPDLPRPDVAAIKGIPGTVGFDLRMPVTARALAQCDPPGLVITPCDGAPDMPSLSLKLLAN